MIKINLEIKDLNIYNVLASIAILKVLKLNLNQSKKIHENSTFRRKR